MWQSSSCVRDDVFLLTAFSGWCGSRRGRMEGRERTDDLETSWLRPSCITPILSLLFVRLTSQFDYSTLLSFSSSLTSSTFMDCPEELPHRDLMLSPKTNWGKRKSDSWELENDLHFLIHRDIQLLC